ncbi:diacylglycerol/lipid kinase family protein [Mesobacillus zeae]|uniref:YegS/Rv2252/BmrU family lipid kinase n=1 Tax=Mesobacillus zeae TaxID=1917180 RepID=A0A398BD59_9BACI|nr:YegS/Rv2252/BmrU family lipid kinase [Mesobacillus zeae]RID85700.1 YegS/Rv2252/BmrU family lipid kinase [Mesobacillus zeae]
MRFSKALLIYNGNAGQKNIDLSLGASVPVLSSAIPDLHIIQTERQGHATELCERYGSEVDAVFILGGDGTVHECTNGLARLEKPPVIGLLPGGTCNDFSRTLGIDQDIRRASEQLINGVIVPVDAIKIDDGYSLNFWGIGLIAQTSLNIEDSEKDRFGKIGYFLSAIRTVKDMEHFEYTIEMDGKEIRGEAKMIIAMNGSYIGTNQLPFQGIRYDDGLIDLFIIKNTNLTLIKEILTNDPTVNPNTLSNEIDHFTAKQIKVETSNVTEADMDGEVYTETPSQIAVLKHRFRMLKPENV